MRRGDGGTRRASSARRERLHDAEQQHLEAAHIGTVAGRRGYGATKSVHSSRRGGGGGRGGAQCPPLVWGPGDVAARRFPSTNARVSDPVAELVRERNTAPWTPVERRIFQNAYLEHPKVRDPCSRAYPGVTSPLGGNWSMKGSMTSNIVRLTLEATVLPSGAELVMNSAGETGTPASPGLSNRLRLP